MKIPGDTNNSKRLELQTDGNTAKQAATDVRSHTQSDSDAVKTSLGKVLTEVEATERRAKILELKTRYESGTLAYDSTAVASKVAETIDEEIIAESKFAENS